MGTSRPRHTLTETDWLAAALDEAARRWPEDRTSRSELLRRLVATGYEAIRAEHAEASTRQRDAVRRTSGALTGQYPPDYLRQLRTDWPE